MTNYYVLEMISKSMSKMNYVDVVTEPWAKKAKTWRKCERC